VLLRGQRLITVTGPGGTGKPRLALQVAAEHVGAVADGVFWVGLGSLTDPVLVPSEIAHAIGARDDLRGFLRGRRVLILLDNFERLLPAAMSVADLLAQAPNLRLLVTSRAPLHLSGEVECKLDPLATTDAVALFVERARAVGRQVEPDSTARKICARLGGLPLAIEVAAARTRLLAPAALLARLEKALAALTQGSRDAPARQHTLRATIEWCHGLLDAESQRSGHLAPDGLMLGARSFPGNPYDGHILSAILEQATNLMQDVPGKIKVVVADLGFRGVDAHNPGIEIIRRGKFKSLNPQQKAWLRRRQAAEQGVPK
jgi:predicted ATPase